MMYVNTNSSEVHTKKRSRIHQMGVPLTEFPQKGKKSNKAQSFGQPFVKTTENKSLSISAGKIILFTVIFGLGGMAYLNHIFSTQQRLAEVLQLQREYEKVRRVYADRKFTYDRMIGPAEVYERAKKLGLSDGGPADGIIIVGK